MKTKNYQIIFLMTVTILLAIKSFSQPGYLTLTFSGDNNGQPVSLESVWVKNLTQNCDTTIYAPDLTLVIDTILTGISNPGISGKGFSISQNFPNPFTDQTTISIDLPEDDYVEIRVNNLLGQQMAVYSGQLSGGSSNFLFFPGSERFYILTVKYKLVSRSIRMISSGLVKSGNCILKYQGSEGTETFKSAQNKNYFDFNPGDQLLFVGHTSLEESGILDSPTANKEYVIQCATNIPCIGNPTVLYEGQTYNTIQIYSQCWLKENLNVGIMIPSTQSQTNNSIIEKYCMGNEESMCDMMGGLYFWNEMMEIKSFNIIGET